MVKKYKRCGNLPLIETTGEFCLVSNVERDFGKILKKAKQTNSPILLSFNLGEKDLNYATGQKIFDLLHNLKENRIDFKVSKPIPECVLGTRYNKISSIFNIPKDCYECGELFTVKDEEIISCKYINKKGPKVYYIGDRNQVWEFFNTLRLEKKPSEKCKKCLYFKRKTCDGLCFRLY